MGSLIFPHLISAVIANQLLPDFSEVGKRESLAIARPISKNRTGVLAYPSVWLLQNHIRFCRKARYPRELFGFQWACTDSGIKLLPLPTVEGILFVPSPYRPHGSRFYNLTSKFFWFFLSIFTFAYKYAILSLWIIDLHSISYIFPIAPFAIMAYILLSENQQFHLDIPSITSTESTQSVLY